MRFAQFVLFVVAMLACCSTFSMAEDDVQIQNLVADSVREIDNEGRRYLKGKKKTSDTDAMDEERGLSFKQFLGAVKLPKFSKLPGVKQLDQFRINLAKKIGAAHVAKARKKYDANPQNFI